MNIESSYLYKKMWLTKKKDIGKRYSQLKCCAHMRVSGELWGLLRQACPLPFLTLFILQRMAWVYPSSEMAW